MQEILLAMLVALEVYNLRLTYPLLNLQLPEIVFQNLYRN